MAGAAAARAAVAQRRGDEAPAPRYRAVQLVGRVVLGQPRAVRGRLGRLQVQVGAQLAQR